jgi:hypothetical protein
MMYWYRWTPVAQAVLFAAVLTLELPAQEAPETRDRSAQTAEGVVRHLYDLVTFEAGTTPDWNVVRALFIDEAVVVLRTSRDSSSVFSVDGFVQDFISFIERANVEQTGFVEHIVRMKTMVFKDIAHVLVLYEASIPGSPRPPQQGIDSFQLIRQGGRWLIASVMNDIPDPDHPVPTELGR